MENTLSHSQNRCQTAVNRVRNTRCRPFGRSKRTSACVAPWASASWRPRGSARAPWSSSRGATRPSSVATWGPSSTTPRSLRRSACGSEGPFGCIERSRVGDELQPGASHRAWGWACARAQAAALEEGEDRGGVQAEGASQSQNRPRIVYTMV